jgi:hypothetical protein
MGLVIQSLEPAVSEENMGSDSEFIYRAKTNPPHGPHHRAKIFRCRDSNGCCILPSYPYYNTILDPRRLQPDCCNLQQPMLPGRFRRQDNSTPRRTGWLGTTTSPLGCRAALVGVCVLGHVELGGPSSRSTQPERAKNTPAVVGHTDHRRRAAVITAAAAPSRRESDTVVLSSICVRASATPAAPGRYAYAWLSAARTLIRGCLGGYDRTSGRQRSPCSTISPRRYLLDAAKRQATMIQIHCKEVG